MIQITRTQMRNILSNVNNPDMISFVSMTPEKMNQYLDYWLVDENGKKKKNPNPTPNPYFESGIVNHSKKYKIITGFDYENSVNNRLKREGKEPDFVGGYKPELMWNEDGTPMLDENGVQKTKQREVWFDMISKGLVTDKKTRSKFYLRYQYLKDSIISTEYLFNGDPIMKQLFESYLTKKSENSYSNQGLDDTLNFQVCDLNNITEISMGGEKYELID
jgi:hypothetical protein